MTAVGTEKLMDHSVEKKSVMERDEEPLWSKRSRTCIRSCAGQASTCMSRATQPAAGMLQRAAKRITERVLEFVSKLRSHQHHDMSRMLKRMVVKRRSLSNSKSVKRIVCSSCREMMHQHLLLGLFCLYFARQEAEASFRARSWG